MEEDDFVLGGVETLLVLEAGSLGEVEGSLVLGEGQVVSAVLLILPELSLPTGVPFLGIVACLPHSLLAHYALHVPDSGQDVQVLVADFLEFLLAH